MKVVRPHREEGNTPGKLNCLPRFKVVARWQLFQYSFSCEKIRILKKKHIRFAFRTSTVSEAMATTLPRGTSGISTLVIIPISTSVFFPICLLGWSSQQRAPPPSSFQQQNQGDSSRGSYLLYPGLTYVFLHFLFDFIRGTPGFLPLAAQRHQSVDNLHHMDHGGGRPRQQQQQRRLPFRFGWFCHIGFWTYSFTFFYKTRPAATSHRPHHHHSHQQINRPVASNDDLVYPKWFRKKNNLHFYFI